MGSVNPNQVVSGTAAKNQARVLTATKGISLTGMVHRAHRVKDGYYVMPDGDPYYQLVQDCGMSRRQRAFLFPAADDAEVTCKKCR